MLASIFLFAGGALALSRLECLASNSANLAAFSDCGHHGSLNFCLSNLKDASHDALTTCFVNAGCSDETAAIEARYTLDRCDDYARAGDLRRRYRAGPQLPARTPSPSAAEIEARSAANYGFSPLNELFGRQDETTKSSLECYRSSTVSTSTCPEETNDGKVKTLSCFSTDVLESDCAPGLTCTMDKQGNDICMELENALSTAGIIISIVFGSALVAGIGSLTFLCCKDRKDQKRLAAKAEATALARAATKKQRAADRAPLMRHQEGAPIIQTPTSGTPPPLAGGADPFSDQHRS